MYVRALLLPLCFSFALGELIAQEADLARDLVGHWSGNFIRQGNSTQSFTVDIAPGDSGLVATLAIADWIGYEPTTSVVTIMDDVARFDGPYGRIAVVADTEFGELVGACGFAQVHLKRAVAPARPAVVRTAHTFDLGDLRVQGSVVRPAGPGPFTTLLLVQGRGCGTQAGWQRMPEEYAMRGLAVVTYDKRGGVGEARDCDAVTIAQHAADLVRVVDQVKAMPGIGTLGLVAASAGGWAAYRTAALRPKQIGFLVTLAAPATSVREQQLDCATYFVRDELGLDTTSVREAQRYTDLQYGTDRAQVYAGLSTLLDSTRAHGWIDVLDASDIPTSEAEVDQLWVRRNVYDPTEDLRAFRGPFLALLGEADNIVPWRENSARFRSLFAANGSSHQEVMVFSAMGHGLEHGHRVRDLGFNPEMNAWSTYFKFDRVDPRPLEQTIAFLRKQGLLK